MKGRPEENPTEWVDKDSGLVYNNEKEAFKSCHEIKPVDPTVAYVEVVGDNGISQVQMCPYFMSWLKEKEFTSFKDTAPSSVQTKKLLMKAVTKVLKSRGLDFLTEIDVLSLFDKVILHELTHTRPGQQTNDVSFPWHLQWQWLFSSSLFFDRLIWEKASEKLSMVGSDARS